MGTPGPSDRWHSEPRTITVWDTALLGPTTTDRAVLLVAQAFQVVGPDAPVRAATAVRRVRLAEAPSSPLTALETVRTAAEGDVQAVEEAIELLTDAWHPAVRGRAARAAMLLRRLHRELKDAGVEVVLPDTVDAE